MDSGTTPTTLTRLGSKTDSTQGRLSRNNPAAPANDAKEVSSRTLTLSTDLVEEEEDHGQNEDSSEGFKPEALPALAAEKGKERGEATLFRRTYQVRKLRQFMPSIIEETEELCKQEEEDDENEAASKPAVVADEHDALFDADFLNFIIETNEVAKDPSQADSEFIQDFGDVLRILRKKTKLEEAFAQNVATQLTAMRIKEKAILLKYIRHLLLHDPAIIEEFYKCKGFLSVLNSALPTDELLDHLPGIILATRKYEPALRELMDEGVINILVKLSRKTEEAVITGAAIAQACLIEVQGVDEQAVDTWFECLLELASGKSTTAQTYACATLCKTTAHTGQQAKILQKAGTAPFFRIFNSQDSPEALLWVSGATANLANNSANFQDFLQTEALDVLHSMSSSIWDEIRLQAAWILVFLSLHKALHQQAIGHWGAWVREALTIGLCSNDSLTTAAIRLFFANVTEQEKFKSYESPLVRNYLKTLHLSDDLVRDHAEALLYTTARDRPTDLIEALLSLCCTEKEAEQNIALKALSCFVLDKEFEANVAPYNILCPFVFGVRSSDGSTQLLCAQVLTSYVSSSRLLQDFQDLEPVSALLFLCDSKHDEVRTAALRGLWVALEVGLRHPEPCAIPILRCCKEDESAETLRACYEHVIAEARKKFAAEWSGRISDETLFGVYSLSTLLHDSSAAAHGRLAYEIERFSEDQSILGNLDEVGARMLIYALMSLGESVVDAVKCNVVTVFTRLMSSTRPLSEGTAFRANTSKNFPRRRINHEAPDASLHCFLAESYAHCICGILLDPSAGATLKQHCLYTLRESLDDPAVCRCLGTTDFMSRLFSLDTAETGDDLLSFYMIYCKLLTHPTTVGHVSDYLSTLEGLLRDAKGLPAVVLPLARLLHASSFLPQVQGVIYSHLKEVCELVIDSAKAGATSGDAVVHFLEALARLSRVPGSRFQQFGTNSCCLPRPVLLDLLALLKRYSAAPESHQAPESQQLGLHEPRMTQALEYAPQSPTVEPTAPLQEEIPPSKDLEETGDQRGCGEMQAERMLKCTVKALLALYRLGAMQGQFDAGFIQLHLLPVFQNMRHAKSFMIPLLSFANILCEDPAFLDCLLSSSIVSDIASGLTEGNLHDEELCVQVAEFLRVAVLHEGAQVKILADIALVDCIFRLIRSSHPPAQSRALFALYSIIEHESILRMIAAESFVQTLCTIALRGKTVDVQQVAAGVLSALIARPSCRDILITATAFRDLIHLVRVATTPEVFLQVVWALSCLPLTDDIVQALIDQHVPDRLKELLADGPPRVQIEAVNSLAKLGVNAKLRHRFIKLEVLPVLVKMAKNTPQCCAALMKVLCLLCESATEAASILDLGIEVNINDALQKWLHQSQNAAGTPHDAPRAKLLPEEEASEVDAPCYNPTIVDSRRTELDEMRISSLALLCQLCKQAVHDQLALLGDETVKTVVRCLAITLPRDLGERRSVSTLFHLWSRVGKLRKLLLLEGGFDVVMKLVTQADDATEMEELSSCLGNFACDADDLMETRLAESGAIEALQTYAVSRHENVRESAKRALRCVAQETLEYSRLLATRETHTLGLSIIDQENRALLKVRSTKAGAP